MNTFRSWRSGPIVPVIRSLGAAAILTGGAACHRPGGGSAPAPAAGAAHRDVPPHGGTPVLLGGGAYCVEFVRDPTAGAMVAYILDGEMEDFIRVGAPSFAVDTAADGETRQLVFTAVPNRATGETLGDTSCFEARADWLKTTAAFAGVLVRLDLRGTTVAGVRFNFPQGNDGE